MNAITELFRMGLNLDMPADDYHAIPAMSAGGLKRMQQSPAHFYGLQLDPDRPPPGDPSPAIVNGTLVHCALFEPSELDSRYVIRPEGMSFASKDGKAWRDAQTRIIVDASQMAAARAQSARLRALPDLGALLADGVGESSAFWIDDHTGELCKCRPDWTSPTGGGVIIVDGKTCQDASPEGFGRSVIKYSYDLQAVHYSAGYEAATGKKVLGFLFAAVESSWPHQAATYMLSDEWLDSAARRRRRLIDLYAECKRSGQWPGYREEVQLLTAPRWFRLEDES